LKSACAYGVALNRSGSRAKKIQKLDFLKQEYKKGL